MAKSRVDEAADSIERAGEDPPPKNLKLRRRDGLSTGSTLLNLALTDNPFIGFIKGKYFFFVGGSGSGKTFLAMSCFAEACVSSSFKGYRLIYDNAEDGMLMNVEKLFGPAVARRLEPPRKDGKKPVFSYTVEDFYYHLDDAVEAGKPFIYVLDSMDSLTSAQEQEKFQAHKRVARGKGRRGDDAGSYGDGKAKINSAGLRAMMSKLLNSGSILIILSQTRDNIGFGFEKDTRSGGRALKFYATTEVWSKVTGQIKKTVRRKTRSIGVHSQLKVKKNRLTGKLHAVEIDIYPSYGIDDIGTCVDYLVEEGWWEKKGKAKTGSRKRGTGGPQSIEAGEFDVTLPREQLIKKIEEEGWENELRAIVGECWAEIEAASAPSRKGRYTD